MVPLQPLGHQAALARSAIAPFSEKGFEKRFDARWGCAVLIDIAQLRGQCAIARFAAVELLRPSLTAPSANIAAKHLGLDVRRRHARRQAESVPQRLGEGMCAVERAESLGEGPRLFQQVIEL